MENVETFKKVVADSSLIRYEINDDHFAHLRDVYNLYKNYFGRDAKDFKAAKNTLYYKGGWPKPETLPRAQNLANSIADSFIILSYIGKVDELNHFLSMRGLKIEPVSPSVYEDQLLENSNWQGDAKREKKVLKLWSSLFVDEMPNDPKTVLTMLMDRACDRQGTICKLADEIKINNGQLVEEECGVKVPNFLRSVNLEYKKIKGKNISEVIDKMKADNEETLEAVEIIENTLENFPVNLQK